MKEKTQVILNLYEKYKDFGRGKWIQMAKELNIDNPEKVRSIIKYYRKKGVIPEENNSVNIENFKSVVEERIIPEENNSIDIENFKSVVEEVITTKKYISPTYKKPFKGKIKENAVLLLSDIHCGKINKFLDIETGKVEETYNEQIMIQKFNKLIESIYSIIKLLSYSYDIKKLYIFGLGDFVDNNLIFKGQRFFIEYGVGKQVLTLVKVLADFIEELLSLFEEIEFVGVIGNHGRLTERKEASPVENSFDYLTYKILETYFRQEKRVKFDIPKTWFYVKSIENHKFLLHHGDCIYSWMGIPYYGITRQSKARQIEIPHNIECIGHFHQRMEIPVSSRSFCLVNGSFIDKDDFAWRKYGVLSKAEQYFFGVSKKRSRTWSFSLDLKENKNEK